MSSEIILTGTIRIPAGSLDRVRPAMAAMVAASRAEPGCLVYHYAEDVLEPGLIHVIERWSDLETLAAHSTSAHMRTWREAWPDLGITDRRMRRYEGTLIRAD
jgi:quinol monooxygenase YgiN